MRLTILLPRFLTTMFHIHEGSKVLKHAKTRRPTTTKLPSSTTHISTTMRCFGTEISGNRRPKAELSPETRSAILYSLEKGISPSKIAFDHRVSRSSIYYTKKRFQQTASIKSRPRSGRPAKINRRTRRYIFRLARKHPRWSYAAIGANIPSTNDYLSKSTIKRVLRTYGLRKWKSKKRIPLNKETAKKRRAFCRNWAGFDDWEKFIFSDECSAQRGSNSPVQFVLRFQTEAFLQEFINLKPHGRDISQIIWGGI